MEISEIFRFCFDFGKHEKDTCVNISGMNVMFDIPYNLQLGMKFSIHMINITKEKQGLRCTDYLRPIVLLVFALVTTLNKFCFRTFRKKMINLVLVSLYINKKNAFSKALQKSLFIMVRELDNITFC